MNVEPRKINAGSVNARAWRVNGLPSPNFLFYLRGAESPNGQSSAALEQWRGRCRLVEKWRVVGSICHDTAEVSCCSALLGEVGCMK